MLISLANINKPAAYAVLHMCLPGWCPIYMNQKMGAKKALEAHPEIGLPSVRKPARASRVIWRLLTQPTSLASLGPCLLNNPAWEGCLFLWAVVVLCTVFGKPGLVAFSRKDVEDSAVPMSFALVTRAPRKEGSYCVSRWEAGGPFLSLLHLCNFW